MLCIDIPISSDKDSLKYTITLFETVERQKKELENKNIDLKRLNKQRMTMMDHLSQIRHPLQPVNILFHPLN